ncbi:MAG: glycosyltransferase [Moorellales bacterium]
MLRPRVSLCLIAKDEEANLPRCLASVAGLVDEVIVVDTGSSDRTPELARTFGARVFHLPWEDDFARARNYSLEQASGQWIFCLDADEELVGGRERLGELLAAEGVEGYWVEILNLVDTPEGVRDCLRHYSLRLWRHRPHYRFRGPIHEEIFSSIREARPEARLAVAPLRIVHYGYTAAAKKVRNKAERNLRIVERALAADPANPELKYYQGLEYWQLGRPQKAAECFAEAWDNWGWEQPLPARLVRDYAVCLLALERYPQARQIVERGLAWYPDYPDLLYLLAHAQRALGQREEAVESLNRCLALGEAGPGYVTTLGTGGHKACLLAGEILEEMELFSEAAKAYTVALQRAPNYLPALYGLMRVLSRLGDPAWCVAYLDRYFDFTTPRAVAAVVGAAAAAGTTEVGIRLAQKALAGAPEEPAFRRELARAYLLRAKEILDRARHLRGVPRLEEERERIEAALAGAES